MTLTVSLAVFPVFCFVVRPLFCLQLAIFHCVLLYRGQTTYEFVALQNKRARQRDAPGAVPCRWPAWKCVYAPV